MRNDGVNDSEPHGAREHIVHERQVKDRVIR